MGAEYLRAKGYTDRSATEQWARTVNSGTILYHTDAGIQRTDVPLRSVNDLTSAITADLDDEVTAIDVYVSTRETATRLIEAAYRTEVFRETPVRLYVETKGTYTRYTHIDVEEAAPSTSVYTAALQQFIGECLDETDEQMESATRDELYEQFSRWYRNLTGCTEPSRPEFGILLAAEGVESPPRGANVGGDNHQVNPED